MSINSNTIAKLAAITASVALVAATLVIAPAAHAQTTTTTTTTTMAAPTTFTRDLTIGDTGSDVTALQTWLIGNGESIPAGATGYFGTETQAAVAALQVKEGITPAAGYFGPITRAWLNSQLSAGGGVSTVPGCAAGAAFSSTTGQACVATTTTVAGCAPGAAFSSTTGQACTTSTTSTTGSTALSGGEGSINNFQTVGASNVTLGAGAQQQVYGFQFQAGGSDLLVNRIYFDVANINGVGTVRPWNVFETATLTNASGQTVATLDATNQSNWSEDGTVSTGVNGAVSAANGNQIYRLDFENVNQVVKEGTDQSYFLTLSTANAIATGNAGGVYDVGLSPQGMRATDAMGLQQYSTSNASYSTVTINDSVSGSVTLSTGSDNPQTTTLMANASSPTNAVVLNTFTIENTGETPVELYTLPVTLSTASTTGVSMATSSNLIEDLKLYQGTTLLDTESPSSSFTSGSSLNFKNLNFTIPANTTDSFVVQADINPIGNSNPAPSGSSATVTVPATGSTPDIENTGGSIVTISGSSTGYPISFAVNGISIASSPTSATASSALASGGTGTAQTGTFTFTFNVTAFGQTIYVGSTTSAFTVNVIDTSTGTATSTNGAALTSSANRSPDGNWQVNSGQTAVFTVTVAKTAGMSHFFYATLNDIVYGTSDSNASSTSVSLPSTYTTPATQISS